MTDTELVDGCIKEKGACLKALYDRFSGKMFSVCLRYADNREDAEDMLQDGFIKVFNHIKQYKGLGSLEGWIRRIVINTCLHQLMNNKRSAIGMSSSLSEHFDFEDEKDWNIINRMSADEIIKLIGELPAGYRSVLNLFAIDGYSHEEIGTMLNITASTSRSQLTKARRMLKEKLKLTTEIYHHG
jgi:RNA polymerase sigma factor (sigma-70 family)